MMITLFMCFVSVPCFGAEFASGDGTADSPYIITDKYQLDAVREYPNGHFELGADIVFTAADFAEGGAFYRGGKGWEPIGSTFGDAFCGSFDGNGYSVCGLYLCDAPQNGGNLGLFGFLRGQVFDVALVQCEMEVETSSFYTYVGGIVGQNYGTLRRCSVSGTIDVTAQEGSPSYLYVGGIVGYSKEGGVEECYHAGTVSAAGANHTYAGGVVGLAENGAVSLSYNAGSVTAKNAAFAYVGGMVGCQRGAAISDSYNAGTLTVDEANFSYVGGIVGNGDGQILRCYNVGGLFGRYVGGILGYPLESDSDIRHCYYLAPVISDSTVGTPCRGAEMKRPDVFAGFDFETVWTFDKESGYPYPRLDWQKIGETLIFDDVTLGADWFAPYVYDVVAYGIINGKGVRENGIPYFDPQGDIKRGEFAKILAAASGEDLSAFENLGIFADAEGHWAETYINWSYEKGIVTGFPDGTFCADERITREQMAAMLCRYAASQGIDLPEVAEKTVFADDDCIVWSAEYVYAMQMAGIINGYNEQGLCYFKPANNATRAEAATMISRFLDI